MPGIYMEHLLPSHIVEWNIDLELTCAIPSTIQTHYIKPMILRTCTWCLLVYTSPYCVLYNDNIHVVRVARYYPNLY